MSKEIKRLEYYTKSMPHVWLNRFCLIFLWFGANLPANAQTEWSRLLTGVIKAGQAYMITDEQLAEKVKSEVEEMDRQNEVCSDKSKYTQRLNRLTGSMKDANGIKLNFKVYQTTDYNAFAEADDYGYEFLKKNGKNPWAMGLAFKKLKAISQQKDRSKYEELLEAFSSHPDFDERINRMRSKAEKDGYISN